MALRPLRDLIYIVPIRETSDIGVIIKPDSHERRFHQGVVKYRGPLTSGEVQRGDHVFFHGWFGEEIVHESEGPLIALREEDIAFVQDETDDSYLVPLGSLKLLVDRAMAEVAAKRVLITKEEAEFMAEIVERLKERLDRKLYDEMYF